MKEIRHYFKWVTAGFITATGALLLSAALLGFPFRVSADRIVITLVMGALYIVMGGALGLLGLKGKLEGKGDPIIEVRKKVLASHRSRSYLTRVASEDPHPEVRERALERLKELGE